MTATPPEPLAINRGSARSWILRFQDGGSAYQHAQGSPAATWTVNHDLGRRPVIAVHSPGWVEVEAQVVHPTANQAVVPFSGPQAGYAICS